MIKIKKKQFIRNGIILTVTSLLIRIISMSFRIYLSDKIGAEGIGLYQLVLTVYLFFSTVTTSGISLTVTRLVTDYNARNEPSKAKYVTYKCLVISVIISIICGFILFVFADFIGTSFLKDGRTVLSLKILAPSLPFMAFSACLRGYFYAGRKTLQTSGEQLLEQVIEIGVFIFIFTYFSPNELSYACCAIVAGTTCAEFISFFYSLILYFADSRKQKCQCEKVQYLGRKILPIALPVTASSCLRSGLSAIENVLIPSGLKKHGANYTRALSQYGIISGMAMPVLVFPSVFILPFATLIIPEMSQASVEKRKNGIHHMTEKMFRLTLLYSLPVMVIFMFFAGQIGEILYHSNETGFYIALLAPVVPLMYLDSVVDGILKGLNEQVSYLAYNIIDSVIRVILTYILLPKLGIAGVVIVIIVSELLNTSLSIARLLKITGIRIMIFDWIIRPLICICVPCFISTIIPPFSSPTFNLICKISFCCLFYLFFLYFTEKKSEKPKHKTSRLLKSKVKA